MCAALLLSACSSRQRAVDMETVEAYSRHLIAGEPDPSNIRFHTRKLMTDDLGITALCGEVMEQMPANLGEVRRRFVVAGEGRTPRVVWREIGPSFPPTDAQIEQWDACERTGMDVL